MNEKKRIRMGKALLFALLLIVLTIRVDAATIFSDGFESGGLSGWTLTKASGANDWTASTTDPYQGTYHAQSMPQSTTEPASIIERTISTLGYQTITFSYYRKLIGLDAADEFQVKWNSGSGWNILEQTGSNPGDDASYVQKTFSLSSSADNNPSFQIRFECTAGAVSEFCRLDNLLIEGSIIDNTPPIITLNSPKNDPININSVVFNITLNEDGSSVWYTLNNGIINITMSSIDNRNYNHINNSIGEGIYAARFYANDTNGNLNNTVTTTFTIDTISPLILIIRPQNISYRNIQTQLNYSVSDTNLQACWYSLDNGATNNSVNCGQNITGLVSSEGSNSWGVWVNDSAGNTNLSRVTFFVDSIFPLISFGVGTEDNNSIKSQNFIFVNVSAIEANEANITFKLYNNSGLINESIYSNGKRTINWTGLRDGVYFYNATIKDVLNNVNTTETRTIILDRTSPSLLIITPQNISYNNATLLVNILSNGANTWFFNGTANETYISSIYKTFPEGATTIIAYSNDSAGNINLTSAAFFIDSISPSIDILNPESKTYGTNSSLPLNFSVVDLGAGISSCWYKIDSGLNISLPNCANTTFNVTGDGQHTLYLFANDSLGNRANLNVIFSVITNAPALNILSPSNGSFLNYKDNIYLNYSVVSGIGISSCQLWGNFNGSWQLNRTNSMITSENNFFVLNLLEGDYTWGIICNDTQNRISAVNGTFTIDTTFPQIILIEPMGTKTSRDNIPLSFSSLDLYLQNCWYDVYEGITQKIVNRSINCYQNLSYFNLTSDATYILTFYANDSAGNINNLSTSFTINSVPSSSSSGSSSGGGGGGGGIIIKGPSILKQNRTKEISILFDVNGSRAVKRGASGNIKIQVMNNEEGFVNDCKLIINGEMKKWASFNEELKGLSVGERYVFDLNLKIPESVVPGTYPAELMLQCDEGYQKSNIVISVFRNSFEGEFKDYERDVENMNVKILLREFSQQDHDIKANYELSDESGIVVAKGEGDYKLSENEEKEEQISLKIPKDASGEYNFKVLLNDGVDSYEINKEIMLQGKSIAGFAISEGNKRTLVWFGITAISIVVIFFAARTTYKKIKFRKMHTHIYHSEHGRKIIRMDFKNDKE